MLFMPFQVLGIWLRDLLTLSLLGLGIFLLTRWYDHREIIISEPIPAGEISPNENLRTDGMKQLSGEEYRTHIVQWQFGLNWETIFLLAGLALVSWSLGAGWLFSPRLFRRSGNDEPVSERSSDARHLQLPDGSKLRVKFHGPPDGDPVVLVHGWGLDGDEWYYAKRELGSRYRLITWDLPGLGDSARPADRDWNLEKLARDLDAVISLAGDKPVALVGHSIGGMILLTYCKLFPAALGVRVRGMVLAHTTYTNPVCTTSKSGLYTALQKPLLEPLCHLMVWLSPLVRVLNWLSYLNGSAHRSTERDSFSGHETRGQLDFITRYYCKAAPDVIARGMLAMFRYDATDVLSRINVPTLIVTGDRDATCRPEASQYMSDAVPGAKLVCLSQAKHCGLFEHHERFHAALSEFLAAQSHPLKTSSPLPGPVPISH
jgi:pimeloyl-ACP methyl ester carboxylesterase